MTLNILPDFSKKQWLTIFVFAVADFCAACCVSLQSPFYPTGNEYYILKKCAYSNNTTVFLLLYIVSEEASFFVDPKIGNYSKAFRF